MREGLHAELGELRAAAQQNALHRRTPAAIADLAVGLRYYLAYAVDCGATSEEEARRSASARGARWAWLPTAQRLHQEGSDPVRRFLELLASHAAKRHEGSNGHLLFLNRPLWRGVPLPPLEVERAA